MNDHEKIRERLALAAADTLEAKEKEQVMRHIQSCAACADEFNDWQLLVGGLRRLPTPQPRAVIVERARARAEVRLAEEAERRWHDIVMISVILFAWALTLLSWPVIRLISHGFLGMLDPRLNQTWLVFSIFTTLAWLAGAAAAVTLSLHERHRRLV
jgi:anti-sigma factor RsiW